jgi:methylase of polypeptide subunit release factors
VNQAAEAAAGEPGLVAAPEPLRRLRRALDDFGYDPLLRAVRGSYPLTPFPPYEEFRHRLTALPEAERTWYQVLLLGRPIPAKRIVTTFGTEMTNDLQQVGLLQPRGARLATPGLGLAAFEGMYLASSLDRSYPDGRGLKPRAYVGIESYLVAHFLPRTRRVGSVLDLGCGSGLFSMLMAASAERVLAVDVDPVSVSVATFNAALNDCRAMEVRAGDLFDPAGRERFDLVVANPPMIATPDNFPPSTYADGGRDGLTVVRRLLDALAAHLTEEGRALIYVEGFGDERRPRVMLEIERIAARDGFAVEVLILSQMAIGPASAQLARGRHTAVAEYRRLFQEHGARRYYKLVIRLRRGGSGVRLLYAGRYA